LGKSFDTHIVLTIEKKRCKAEITVKVRDQALVGIAEAMEMAQAIGEAMEKIDRQAVRWKTRYRSKKRIERRKAAGAEWKGASAHQESKQQKTQEARIVVGPDEARAVNVVVHAFPGANIVRDAYVVPSSEAVAFRAMSLEEAVKEAEFRNREVFVFRDKTGKVIVLHRKKDGKIELIEAP